jgi:BirA family transcriptional regulator, biotin operon repressor / biotin---[acetyl-CoA-carboxylase] ligase
MMVSSKDAKNQKDANTLNLNKLGSTILRFDRVTSTNDVARDLATSGSFEGICVVAREQTAGRGRQGREWMSASGHGLYLSIILRPEIKAAQSASITLAAAVSVAEAFSLDLRIACDIKWPNDVMVSNKKICGILVESAVEGDRLQYAILGIGINLTQKEFSPPLDQTATSVLIETGRTITIDDLVKPLLERLNHWYEVSVERPQGIIERWEQLSSYARDCSVRIESTEGAFEGITRGLSESGALMLETTEGEIREVVSGDVSLRARKAPVS